MIPLTDIIRRLAAGLFGLEVADAAAVFGTPEAIQSKCHAAGFKDVQVAHHLPCGLSEQNSQQSSLQGGALLHWGLT